MARTGRELAIVHRPQLAAQCLLGDRDAELLPQPSHQIDQTPAHHAVDSRDRASLELRLECGSMRVVEPGGLTGRLAVDQPVGTTLVEFHHPVPHDLQPNPADPGRLGARSPVINRGQRQQTARLRSVLGPAGKRAHSGGIEVSPERNRHGEPPSFATSNLTRSPLTRPLRVSHSGTWYKTRALKVAKAMDAVTDQDIRAALGAGLEPARDYV